MAHLALLILLQEKKECEHVLIFSTNLIVRPFFLLHTPNSQSANHLAQISAFTHEDAVNPETQSDFEPLWTCRTRLLAPLRMQVREIHKLLVSWDFWPRHSNLRGSQGGSQKEKMSIGRQLRRRKMSLLRSEVRGQAGQIGWRPWKGNNGPNN